MLSSKRQSRSTKIKITLCLTMDMLYIEMSELDTQYAIYSILSINEFNQELIQTVDSFRCLRGIRQYPVYGLNMCSSQIFR